MQERLRALGERWPWLGRALEVQDRVREINGSAVAAAITLWIFVSLFPLLLVAIAVVGFLASGNDDLAADIVERLSLTGQAADTVEDAVARAADSRRTASVVGLLGLVWSASAVAVALEQGVRAPWQERPEGLRDRLLGMAWLAAAGLGFAAVIAISSFLNFLPDDVPKALITVAAVLVGVAAEIALFWWMFWGLGPRHVSARELLPGALVAGVGFEAMKLVGTIYVPKLVATSSSLYGPLGVVFAILAWLALLAKLIVYSSSVNAVRYEARAGTVEVPIHVPNLPSREPAAADRGGTIVDGPDPDVSVPEPMPDAPAADGPRVPDDVAPDPEDATL